MSCPISLSSDQQTTLTMSSLILIFTANLIEHRRSTLKILFCFLLSLVPVQSFCGSSIKWSHNVKIDDVYGMWYGAGYAKHTPDLTNKPTEVGCVTLFITDVTTESHEDWLDWSINKKNYSDENWRSYKSNSWSDTPMSGSWLDIKIRNKAKRDIYNERRLRVMWDEDGQTLEQTYLYTPSDPGLWIAEERSVLEKEMMARGIEFWRPDDPPRHPQVIRVLKLTPETLMINHCSDKGDGGIFSLILRRSPYKMHRSEWYDIQRQFFNFELPIMYRHMTICASCVKKSSLTFLLICTAAWMFV